MHGRVEKGSYLEVISSVMGKILTHEVIITSLIPDFKYAVKSYSGPLPFSIESNLSDSRRGTYIFAKSEIERVIRIGYLTATKQ